MKRLMLFFLVLCVVFSPVMALAGWITANQVTVSWDYNDTSDLKEGERLIYRVVMADIVVDPDKANPALVGETLENTLVITMTERGQYRAGVKAVFQINIGDTWEDVAESLIAWSDDPTVTKDGIIFGIRFYPSPAIPKGLSTL